MRLEAHRKLLLTDFMLCVSLFVISVGVYSAMFLHVPVLTETRDFLLNFGRDARVLDVFNPSGDDYRPFSWKFFYWQQQLLGFGAEAVNLVQFGLLGLCAIGAYAHLRQLVLKPAVAFAASVLWLLSLPVAHAAFWQATQHDKLGFLFTVLAMILSLETIRAERLVLIPFFISLTLILSAFAVSTKPIAFILPAAFGTQALLFPGERTWKGRLRAMMRIAIPALYVVTYAVAYMARTKAEWRAHTMAGNLSENFLVYLRNLTNIDFDGNLTPALLLFLPVAVFWVLAFWSGTHPERKAGVYFFAIFASSLTVLASAQHPTAFYLLLPLFAFTTTLVAVPMTLVRSRLAMVRWSSAIALTGVVVGLLLTYALAINGASRLHEWRTSAKNLDAGYKVMRNSVDAQQLKSISFSIPSEPSLFFYFFSDGRHQVIDPGIPSFIFGRALKVPVEDAGLKKASIMDAGTLRAAWSDELELNELTLSGKTIYRSGAVKSLTGLLGKTIEFQKGGDGDAYKGQGWSTDEPWGTWSDGEEATLHIPLDPADRSAMEIVFQLKAFVTKEHPEQSVEILANGEPVANWTFHHEQPSPELRARIPAELMDAETLTLTFKIMNPISPQSIGMSADRRALGILLEKLRIVPAQQAAIRQFRSDVRSVSACQALLRTWVRDLIRQPSAVLT